MKYVIISDERSKFISVKYLCNVLGVSRAGFYKWFKKQLEPPSPECEEKKKLESNVIRVHFNSRKIYGYRKVHNELKNEGIKVNDKKVYEVMRKNGLKAKTKKAFRPRTTDSNHNEKISPRVFQIETTQAIKPNEIWAGDITYIATREGWLYLSLFLDLYSRMVVGWAIGDNLRSELVRESFIMALSRRSPGPGLMIHTDRGVQYTANDFRNLIEALSFVQSMSRRGNCYDNAFVESFFSQMKKELSTRIFETKAEAIREIIDFINNWYNTKRIHSSLGYVSPKQFEANFEVRIAS
jgi:putative transposase